MAFLALVSLVTSVLGWNWFTTMFGAVMGILVEQVRWVLLRPAGTGPEPGARITEIADWILPREDAEGIVAQAVADVREESFQARADGHPRNARWIEIRDTTRILLAIAQAVGHRVGRFALGFFT